MTLRPFNVLNFLVDKIYNVMDDDAIWHQFVLFANFCNTSEEFSSCLKDYLDLKGYTGNFSAVIGNQYKEQKMNHASLFLNDTLDRSQRPVANRIFDSIACLATCTIGAAG
jgi:hypothetical protein